MACLCSLRGKEKALLETQKSSKMTGKAWRPGTVVCEEKKEVDLLRTQDCHALNLELMIVFWDTDLEWNHWWLRLKGTWGMDSSCLFISKWSLTQGVAQLLQSWDFLSNRSWEWESVMWSTGARPGTGITFLWLYASTMDSSTFHVGVLWRSGQSWTQNTEVPKVPNKRQLESSVPEAVWSVVILGLHDTEGCVLQVLILCDTNHHKWWQNKGH